MVIRLQLDNGTIRAYKTWYETEGSEWAPPEYKTKCGINWDFSPHFDNGCDHIDCAIRAAEQPRYEAKALFACGVLWILFSSIFFLDWLLSIFGFFMWSVFAFLSYRKVDNKLIEELIEFRDHGTVNGIKASKLCGSVP